MTVNALVKQLKRHASAGRGELPVWLRTDDSHSPLVETSLEPIVHGHLVLVLKGEKKA